MNSGGYKLRAWKNVKASYCEKYLYFNGNAQYSIYILERYAYWYMYRFH